MLVDAASFVDIPLSGRLPQSAQGTQYAIVLSCGACTSFFSAYFAAFAPLSTYSGGQAYASQNGAAWGAVNSQLAFKTYVAQAPTRKVQCKDGGWQNSINPDTGKPFQNQGECVSWVELHQQ